MINIAVAFVIFNRPEATERSFQKIRNARPEHLFVISDAARPHRDGEFERVERSRYITENIDWNCDVHRIYADQNMGCGRRISSGITWAMTLVDRLIVLEDDCVASESFFPFCAELLDHYEHDERVMAISGNNFQQGRKRSQASYYFSKYPHCWGWATWRRAWNRFDLKIPDWPAFRDSGQLRTFCDTPSELSYWMAIFDGVHSGRSASWAYPWTLNCWMNHGLTVLPEINLVSNIGFGSHATHTKGLSSYANLSHENLESVTHPRFVHRNYEADRFSDALLFSGRRRGGPLKKLKNTLRSYFHAA